MKHNVFYIAAIFIMGAVMLSSSVCYAGSVKGYTRKDGTYVQPHQRNAPDQYRSNNRNSQSNGGPQRDEYSNDGATNRRNSGYGLYDNDRDGLNNRFDPKPESKKNCNSYSTFGC